MKNHRVCFSVLFSWCVMGSAVVLSSSCAVSPGRGTGLPSQLDVQVQSAPRTVLDAQSVQRSQALHAYLVGEIDLQQRNTPQAIKSFSRASRLFDEPVPSLHAKLAELYIREANLSKALASLELAVQEDPENKESVLLQASLLEALDRDDEAQALYRTLVENKEYGTSARLLWGALLLRTGKASQAIAVLEPGLLVSSREPLLPYYLARAYESADEYPRARTLYENTLQFEPRNPYLLLDLIRVLAYLNDETAIRDRCAQLIELDPENQTARRVLLYLELEKRSSENAIENLKTLSSTPITRTDTRFRFALSNLRAGNQHAAILDFSLVLAQEPSHPEARYSLASALASTGNSLEAVEELDLIKKGNPLYVKARTFAAFLLRQVKEYSRAERAVRDALSVEEQDPQILSFLVVILKESKKFDEARAILEKQLNSDPDNDRLLFSYGALLHEMNEEEEAVKVMERVVSLNPRNSDALNFVAFALAEKNNDLERAQQLISQALEVRPNDGYYLDTLGWIHFQRNELEDSKLILSRAVELTDEDPEILEHYGDVLLKLGEHEQAISTYRRALEKLQDVSDASNGSASSQETIKRIREKIDSASTKS